MKLRGTNQEFGRPYNRRIVLETIRRHGPISRAAIARSVGLTLQTVSTITAELLDEGFLLLRAGRARGRGLPAPSLEVDPDGAFALGMHLTPRGLQGALVNLAGNVVARETLALPNVSPDRAFDEIARLARPLREARPGGRLLGIGLAMPGPFDIDSMSFVGPTTLEGWKDVPIVERLVEAVGLPGFLGVDMVAAAQGEQMYGLGARHRTFYYLYLSVGLGGCMIHDGAPQRGAWGNAGEIGHVPLVPGGEPCACGNSGCLERYVSLDAFERSGDTPAAWAAKIAPILRNAVVMIENLHDPETIVFGGLAPDEVLAALAGVLSDLPGSIAARRDRAAPRVTLSGAGRDSVLRGAAALAVSGALSPRVEILFPPAKAAEQRDEPQHARGGA